MYRNSKFQPVTIYTCLGYEDRYDYFSDLAKTFDIPIMKIILKAEQLGPEQDFDELLDWINKGAKDCYSINPS